MKSHFSIPVLFTPALALALTLLTSLPTLAQYAPEGRARGGATYIKFEPPALGNAPGGRSRGGASRGECLPATLPLTAIVPTIDGSVGGLTTADHPTLWFYVPYTLTSDRPAEFVLLDDQNKYVYQTTVVNGTREATGIVRVTLPTTVTLEKDKLYQWVFMVNCEMDNPIFTRGSIRKVTLDPAIASPLKQSTELEKTRIYAENGIWFDALTTLAELKIARPEDAAIAAEWQSLLESVDLADVVDQTFVP
ncbi:MAG TPA: DUF928 domain-containing protein [Coleofasciculaceae cyanobacterium]|jgi:hypothetical protein